MVNMNNGKKKIIMMAKDIKLNIIRVWAQALQKNLKNILKKKRLCTLNLKHKTKL